MADPIPAAKAPRKPAAAPKTAASKTANAKTIGAGVGSTDDNGSSDNTTVDRMKKQAMHLAGEAGDVAKKAAATGKDKAVDALSGVSRLADDAAKSIDQHLGAKYGDYARKASDGVSKAADTLSTKDVDDLIEDAKTVVRKNPLAAIGVAAAVGFLLTRIARIGSSDKA
jgi:ElaB/YqjD/DUF883 family membrane-anchored ribosome-binding protein